MSSKQWYVTMTDKFMSGWGPARSKINKLVFICDSYDQACIVAANAEKRGVQKNINTTNRKPYYNQHTHYTQYKTVAEYPKWYDPKATW